MSVAKYVTITVSDKTDQQALRVQGYSHSGGAAMDGYSFDTVEEVVEYLAGDVYPHRPLHEMFRWRQEQLAKQRDELLAKLARTQDAITGFVANPIED